MDVGNLSDINGNLSDIHPKKSQFSLTACVKTPIVTNATKFNLFFLISLNIVNYFFLLIELTHFTQPSTKLKTYSYDRINLLQPKFLFVENKLIFFGLKHLFKSVSMWNKLRLSIQSASFSLMNLEFLSACQYVSHCIVLE